MSQSLSHPVVFYKRKPQFFWSSFDSCSLQWRSWQHYEYVRLSTLKNCQCHTGHLPDFCRAAIKKLTQGVKLFKPIKCTTAIDYCLCSDFLDLEHLSWNFEVLLLNSDYASASDYYWLLLVTWWLLLDTGGYCSLPLVTACSHF